MDKFWKSSESHAFGEGAKRRRKMIPSNAFASGMEEFKHKTLHSGSGDIVTDPTQAKAILISEAKKRALKRIKG
jgi:hypothetical protein